MCTQTKKPLVFFGTEDFSAISLQALIDAGFNVAAIITKPDSKRGRGQKIQSPIVKEIGEKFNIPVLQPAKMNEIADFVEKMPIKPIGVLVSFGRIIPQTIIDLFDGGIINLHPSLLPKYRGPSPIESAILNGDQQTGISIMALTAKMDAGPVYYQEIIELSGSETASQLYDLCGKIGAKALTNILPAIISKKITPTLQIEEQSTYCKLLNKNDALLQPKKQTAQAAEQQIRAYEIFPRTKIEILGHNLIILDAKVESENPENSPLVVKFSDGNFLKITKIIAPSGKAMDAISFINGYSISQKS